MFGVALILSIFLTSFLFVYISTQLGSATENIRRPIFVTFLNSLKGLLIFSAMILPAVAIASNEAIWAAAGISRDRLSIYSTAAYTVAIYIPIILITLILIFLITEAILSAVERRRK